MDSPLDVEVHPHYLHIKHPPGYVITAEAADSVWGRIATLCRDNGIHKVLVEAERPERRLDTMSAFDSGRVLAENTSGLTIAICFLNYEFDDLSAFFKTVAQNRGVNLDFFSDLDAARKWLDVDTGENAAGSG